MIVFWVLAVLMVLLALVWVLRPLLSSMTQLPPAGPGDQDVYKSQLAELERDAALGVISKEEAKAAEIEVQRRLLNSPDRDAQGVGQGSQVLRQSAVAITALLPLAALALYFNIGNPAAIEMPRISMETQAPTIDGLVAELERRLEEQPDDVEGWATLAQAYASLGRYDAAVTANQKAIALDPSDANVHAALGEALAMAADGTITDEAKASLNTALALDPKNPRARFYRGLELYQSDQKDLALQEWESLLADSQGDEAFLPGLRSQIAGVRVELGLAETVTPDATPDLDMIEGMVEGLAARLEESPNDVEGWQMLARSYSVLGRDDEARLAYEKLAALQPEDLQAQVDYAASRMNDVLKRQIAIDDETLQLLTRIHETDPTVPMALLYLGAASQQRGELSQAEGYWQQLLTQSDPGSADHAMVQSLLDRLSEPSAEPPQ